MYDLYMKIKSNKYIFLMLLVGIISISFSNTVEAAWKHNETGWRWTDAKNYYSRNTWENIQGNWYYFGDDGYMEYGWQYINGSWYYLGGSNDGAMKYGWQYINGNWYYLGGSNDGAMKYGWQYINGSWYYLGGSNDGAMKHGWQYVNENWYYLGDSNDGSMRYGWQNIDDGCYYLGPEDDGAMRVGWQEIDGLEYFFYEDGRRATIITQYSDMIGSQAMFYTIETIEGDLIVVDGGTTGNAEHVRNVIKEKGGIVSAWILTHPHPDHIGAFNIVYADLQGIEVDDIYAIDMDYELYKENARPWDEFNIFDEFVTLTENSENVHYLYTDDVIQIGGCELKVYNAYDETTIDISTDLCNIGSLVFEIFGENSSMLFCADVYGKAMSNKLIEKYGDELKATYIQMGHHGNNTMSHDFLDIVYPEIAFFDAPDWLISNTKYDTQSNINYMKSLGAEIYTYETVPNRVILE